VLLQFASNAKVFQTLNVHINSVHYLKYWNNRQSKSKAGVVVKVLGYLDVERLSVAPKLAATEWTDLTQQNS